MQEENDRQGSAYRRQVLKLFPNAHASLLQEYLERSCMAGSLYNRFLVNQMEEVQDV
jgi:hypothetical protein